MPNFANKVVIAGRIDAATLLEMTRASVVTTATRASPNRKLNSISFDSKFIAGSSATNSTVQHAITVRTTAIPRSLTATPAGPYSWFLFDTDGIAWTTDETFSTFTSTGTVVPTATTGTYRHCVWTGTYWYWCAPNADGFYRGSEDLKTWTRVAEFSGNTYNWASVTLGATPSTLYHYSNAYNVGGKWGTLYKSTDGGLTWTLLRDGTIDGSVRTDLIFSNGRLIWCAPSVYFSGVGRIQTSDDDGATITTRYDDPGGVRSCHTPVKIGSTIVAGWRQGRVITSTDNGSTWTVLGSTVAGQEWLSSIKYTGSVYVAADSTQGPVWSTTLAGPYTKGTSATGDTLSGFNWFSHQLSYSGTTLVYYDRTNGAMHTSLDGKVWTRVAHPVPGKTFTAAFPKVTDPNKNLR
jgi:hypothetical protein